MKKMRKRRILIIAGALIAVLFMMGAVAEASQYYYFKKPTTDGQYTAGNSISVSFWAGVEYKEVKCDQWGNPSETIYHDMPVTLKVFKGSTELYSKSFKYKKATTITTSYKPNTSGSLKLCVYGRNEGLNNTAEVLQDTVTIKVKAAKPAAVKKIKPTITVERTGKKKAKITCTNDTGFGMKVYRATKKKGKYKLIKKTKKSTFTDTKLSAKKVYYYKVRLFSKKGKKNYVSKWSAVKKAPKYVASADNSALKVSVTNTSKGVKISWKKYSKAGYYLVSRGTTADEGEVITCNGENECEFYDTEAVKGKTYYYQVTAWYGNDEKPMVKSKAIKIKVQ